MSHPHQRPREPLFEISLMRHTGVVIMGHQQIRRHIGTLAMCEQAYGADQTHCLLAGWWSPFLLLAYDWIALFANLGAIRRVRTLAADPLAAAQLQYAMRRQKTHETPALPGWYPDPASRWRRRYWDGGAWTDFTHPPRPQ